MLDTWAMSGQTEEALAALDRLRVWVGEDAWLDHLAANVLYLGGRTEEAKVMFVRATDVESDLKEPRWSLVSLALDEKDFAAVAGQLAALEELGAEIGDLVDLPLYAEFIESEEYIEWMVRRNYVRALDADDRLWLVESRVLGRGLFSYYEMALPAGEELVTGIPDLIQTWLADEADEKPDPWLVMRGLGALFGDAVARQFGLEWRLAFTPQTGESLILVHDDGRLQLDPIDAVAAQLDGFPLQSLTQWLEEAALALDRPAVPQE